MSIAVEAFEAERGRLLSVAYRITGSVADAEDAVQEAWLRLDRAGSTPDNLQAWLTTVVSRLCLDRLGSAARRRETYVGQWLPEPIVRPYEPGPPDPLDVVVHRDDVRFGALVVLDRLSPPQRVALVLHDAFGVPFDEIATILDSTPAAARQLASRARKSVADAPPPVDDAEHEEAVWRFLEAMASGDVDAVVATLHPDAFIVGDANGTTGTTLNVIRGPRKFARFYLGLVSRYGDDRVNDLQFVRVNGQLGIWTDGWQGGSARTTSPSRAAAFTVRDGRVLALYDLANPEKLGGVRLPTEPGTPHPS